MGLFDDEESWSEAGSESDATAKAIVKPNGPLVISGSFELYDADGKLTEQKERVSICRCGATGTTPYCDGSHNRTNFKG